MANYASGDPAGTRDQSYDRWEAENRLRGIQAGQPNRAERLWSAIAGGEDPSPNTGDINWGAGLVDPTTLPSAPRDPESALNPATALMDVLPPNATASPQFTDTTGFLNPSLEGVAPQVEPTPTGMPADIAENYPAVEPTTSGTTPTFPGGTGVPPLKPAVPTQRTTERGRADWAGPEDSIFATGVPDPLTALIRGGSGIANFINDLLSSRHVGPGPDENPEHLARRQLIDDYRRRMEQLYPRGPKYSSEGGGFLGGLLEAIKQNLGGQGTDVTPRNPRKRD